MSETITTITCRQCGHVQEMPSLTELAMFTLNAFGWKYVTAPQDIGGLMGLCDDCVVAAASDGEDGG